MTAICPDGQMYIQRFPPGVVALDFDAPSAFFYLGNPGTGRKEMIKRVKEVADELSHKYGLGLYWIYETLSGLHVIFQNKLASHQAALDVMADASNRRDGWHECGGHLTFSAQDGYVSLRVGHKSKREWDLYPYKLNPPASICPHVEEHEALLTMRLPGKEC
jgi:hypothetical protein